MNNMKQILALVALFFILIVIPLNNVYAQLVALTPVPSLGSGMGVVIPGKDCGSSVSPDPNARKCCKKQTTFVDTLGKSLTDLVDTMKKTNPFLGVIAFFFDPFNNLKTSILQLDREYAPIACPLGYPSTQDPSDPNCTCLEAITPSPINKLKEMCSLYFKGSREEGSCISCADGGGAWTALGCVYGDTGKFLQETVFSWAVGFAGTLALICIIYAAFTLQSSRGNPEKLKRAQELLTSCIMGLMLILFSVFILKLIGVNILKIPGFG